jgi:protoporphyrinogen IX oxidase
MNWFTLIPYLKAVHIIGFVVWFAGLFYLVRLFIYHVEARQRSEPEAGILHRQFSLMEWRLFYIITWPGMVITLICGSTMIAINPLYLAAWLYLKLALIFILIGYHFWCGTVLAALSEGKGDFRSGTLRIMNEVATLLLVAIVFLAVMRSLQHFIYGFAGFIGFAILLFAGIAFYKKIRNDRTSV